MAHRDETGSGLHGHGDNTSLKESQAEGEREGLHQDCSV